MSHKEKDGGVNTKTEYNSNVHPVSPPFSLVVLPHLLQADCTLDQWCRNTVNISKVLSEGPQGFVVLRTPPPHTELRTQNHNKQMDVHFEDFRANQHTVEVGADDTVEDLRRKVASAMGLPEDSFCMSFGDEAMGEGADMTQLSVGDTIILTKTQKHESIAALHALGVTDITAEALATVEDPEVACLLLQAEVATVIPDGFLSGSSLTTLDLSAVSFVTRIGDEFLYDCTSLTSIDLCGLRNVTVVGDNFLRECTSLTSIDIFGLRSVTVVGDSFLAGCMFTTLDLSPLSNVTVLGHCFLASCKFTTLDLSPLSSLTEIGGYFLWDCVGLTTLDLSRLSRVTLVGSPFVDFASLKSIYLTGCSSAVSDEVKRRAEQACG